MTNFTTKRITGIRNGFNGFLSEFDVEVVPTALGNIVIVHEPGDNPGPSITNCAEYACPAIAVALNLPWESCVFVESYPPRGGIRAYDRSFDHIHFDGHVTERHAWGQRELVPYAPLAESGWSPLSPECAMALDDAGYVLSCLIGRTGTFRISLPGSGGICRATILGYDGLSYLTARGTFLHTTLISVEDAEPMGRPSQMASEQ